MGMIYYYYLMHIKLVSVGKVRRKNYIYKEAFNVCNSVLLVGKNYIIKYFTKFSCMFEQLLYRQVDLVHPNLLS
jgi:hypothetical protein